VVTNIVVGATRVAVSKARTSTKGDAATGAPTKLLLKSQLQKWLILNYTVEPVAKAAATKGYLIKGSH